MAQKILVIEDDAILRDVLARKLANGGFSVTGATDGESGLAQMRSEKPDLILLDMLLPQKSGIEVMEEMHADPSLASIPVIAISNSGEATEIERAKGLGAKDFLIKAIFDSNDILNKVNKIFNITTTTMPTQVTPPEPVAPTPQQQAPATPTATETSPRPPASGKKVVMIIEDDKFLRELAIQKLTHEGFEAYGAFSGQEAFTQLATVKPHVIILDLILPGMDGYEILAKLKADAATASIPVIILSNLGQAEDIDRAKKLGAHDFMVKAHFSFGEIVKKINSVIQQLG